MPTGIYVSLKFANIKQGDTYPADGSALVLTFTSSADGSPVNFPNGTLGLAQVRLSSNTTTPGALVYSWDSTMAIVSGNTITLSTIPATESQQFTPALNATLEIQTQAPGDIVRTWITETIAIIRDNAF